MTSPTKYLPTPGATFRCPHEDCGHRQPIIVYGEILKWNGKFVAWKASCRACHKNSAITPGGYPTELNTVTRLEEFVFDDDLDLLEQGTKWRCVCCNAVHILKSPESQSQRVYNGRSEKLLGWKVRCAKSRRYIFIENSESKTVCFYETFEKRHDFVLLNKRSDERPTIGIDYVRY